MTDPSQPEQLAAPEKRSIIRRLLRILWRLFQGVLLFFIIYGIVALVGLIPANREFQAADEGVQLYFVSSAVHADVIVPIKNHTVDWNDYFPAETFPGNVNLATHVSIGWGDKGFFLDTPTWSDLKASTTAKALFMPSETCMHVSMTNAELMKDTRSVRVTSEQYGQLVEFILASFERDANGKIIQIPDQHYWKNDAFFEATGTYHCYNTCNSWTGKTMRKAGIKTPMLTPLPKSMFLYLPDQQ